MANLISMYRQWSKF
ncbi:hypothetical protein F383_36290 [Gossypium arboreum]|uniref:Uncharacterized protein n=1 Tax=Gossypium arboreum TaxID=29729 RepID=A0A0B0NAR3_GOSAR|nr:hypothetical protein F383_36290 [Gossypium arboreum]